MITERHFKNEDVIKAKIVDGCKRGVCDRNGVSIKTTNMIGQKVFVAKPRFHPSSVVKVYVLRNGKMVEK